MPDTPQKLRPLWRWTFWRVWCIVALPWLVVALLWAVYAQTHLNETAADLLIPVRAEAERQLQNELNFVESTLAVLQTTRTLSGYTGANLPPIAAALPIIKESPILAAAAWNSTASAAWLYRENAASRWYAVEEQRDKPGPATLVELADNGAPMSAGVPVRVPDDWRPQGESMAVAMQALHNKPKEEPNAISWQILDKRSLSGTRGLVAFALAHDADDSLLGAQVEVALTSGRALFPAVYPYAHRDWGGLQTASLDLALWEGNGAIAPLGNQARGDEQNDIYYLKHENFNAYRARLHGDPVWGSGHTLTLPGSTTLFVMAHLPERVVLATAFWWPGLCAAIFALFTLTLALAHWLILRRFTNALTRDLQEVRRLDVLRGPYYWPRTKIAELTALREAVQEAAAGLDNREAALKDPILLEAVIRAVPVEGDEATPPTENLPLAPPAAFVQAMDTVRRQLSETKRELEALRAITARPGSDPNTELILAERLLVGLRNHTTTLATADTLATGLAIREARLYTVNETFTTLRADSPSPNNALLPTELARAGHPLLFLAAERMHVLWIDDATNDPRCARLFAEQRLPEPHSLVALLINNGKHLWIGLRPRGASGWRAAEQVFAEAIARQSQVPPAAPAEAVPAIPPSSAHALWSQPNLPADPDKPMYREIVDSAAAGIFTLSRAGRFTYLNTTAGKLFGLPQAELLGQPLLDRAATGQDAPLRSALQRIADGASLEESDIHFKRPSGGPLLLRLYLAPLQDESGEPTGITGCVLDVTTLRERELHLTRQEALYRSIVEGAPQLLWSIDAIGCITFINSVSTQIYGHTPQEIIGRPTTILCDQDTAQKDIERMALLMAGRPCTGYRTTHRHKDGTPIPLVVVATRQTDPTGNTTGAIGLAIALADDPTD